MESIAAVPTEMPFKAAKTRNRIQNPTRQVSSSTSFMPIEISFGGSATHAFIIQQGKYLFSLRTLSTSVSVSHAPGLLATITQERLARRRGIMKPTICVNRVSVNWILFCNGVYYKSLDMHALNLSGRLVT